MPIDLKLNARQIAKRLAALDFAALWPGFRPYRFALYDDATVYFDGVTFARTDAFLANTSICINGEHIAIWQLREEMDLDVLTAKMVHEMFHAFQTEHGEQRFANEFEAIQKYQNSAELLALRHEENCLLASLLTQYDAAAFGRLLSLRKYRMQQYPYEYAYESCIEAIEGSAQFVELAVLKVLDAEKHAQALERMCTRLAKLEALLPARIPCYDTGAAMLLICAENGFPLQLAIGARETVFYQELIDATQPLSEPPAVSPKVLAFYEADSAKLKQLVEDALARPETRVAPCGPLLGFNVYSARKHGDYIYTEYFLAYQAEEPVTLMGNFLFRLEDGCVMEYYRLPNAE